MQSFMSMPLTVKEVYSSKFFYYMGKGQGQGQRVSKFEYITHDIPHAIPRCISMQSSVSMEPTVKEV